MTKLKNKSRIKIVDSYGKVDFFINNKKVSEDMFDSYLRKAIKRKMEEDFDFWFDKKVNNGKPYNIYGNAFYPSYILSELDYESYRNAYNDFVEQEYDNYEDKLSFENEDGYSSWNISGYKFDILEKD